MRRDKTVARILLIFSTTNVVFASPAVVPQSHLDVTKAAQKRAGSEDGTTSGTTVNLPPPELESHPLSESHSLSSESSPPAFKRYEDTMRKFNGGSSAPGPQRRQAEYDNPPAESGGHLPPRPPVWRPPRLTITPTTGVPAEIKLAALAVALVGGTALLAEGPQIFKHLKSQRNSVPRELANSDVGRGASKYQSREQLVSRGLANLRDEDLQLLRVLARRALESLV